MINWMFTPVGVMAVDDPMKLFCHIRGWLVHRIFFSIKMYGQRIEIWAYLTPGFDRNEAIRFMKEYFY